METSKSLSIYHIVMTQVRTKEWHHVARPTTSTYCITCVRRMLFLCVHLHICVSACFLLYRNQTHHCLTDAVWTMSLWSIGHTLMDHSFIWNCYVFMIISSFKWSCAGLADRDDVENKYIHVCRRPNWHCDIIASSLIQICIMFGEIINANRFLWPEWSINSRETGDKHIELVIWPAMCPP